jgi:hypothetical protein
MKKGNPFYLTLAILGSAAMIIQTCAYGADISLNTLLCSISDCGYKTQGSEYSRNPDLIFVQAQRFQDPLADAGKWRLVRTPGPEQKEIVSIMHTPALLQSDPDFAGLLIKCRENLGLQIAFAVIRPFPPRTRPQVTVAVDHLSTHFQASVLPSGSLVELPDEAEVLVKGPWQSARQLSVTIEGDGVTIHGIVPLDDLDKAIVMLQSNCPKEN